MHSDSFLKLVLLCLLGIGFGFGYTPPEDAFNRLNRYRSYSELTSAAGSMDIDQYTMNLTTWQMDHGGFYKDFADKYVSAWNGSSAKSGTTNDGVELGTIDNNATIQEMRLLAERYKQTSNNSYKTAYKAAFQKAVNFLLTSQYPSGGWPQMFPERGNYSDMATFNDDAMVRVMVLAWDVARGLAPFDTDIVSAQQKTDLQAAVTKAVDFALNSQIYNNGEPTVWCAQHDPVTYQPVAARSYELASKSGKESGGVVWFLMNWPEQSAEIQNAVQGALDWYKRTRVADMRYDDGNFVADQGESMWYRFYEVDNDEFFFCDRAGVSTKTQDITELSDDRRYGYQWAGDYGSALLAVESDYIAALGSASFPTLTLVSGTTSQTVNSGSAIQNIVYEWGGDATGATAMDLPNGLVATQGDNSLTISGIPNTSGTFTVSTVQPEGNAVSQTGLIQVIPAVNYKLAAIDRCSGEGVEENSNSGYTESAYFNFENALGASAEYVVYASSSLTTGVLVRFANGGSSSRDMSVFVNENVQETISFPSDANWESWQFATVTLQLNSGRNTISLEALSADGGPNIDWLGFTNSEVSAASCEEPVGIGRTFPQNILSSNDEAALGSVSRTNSTLLISAQKDVTVHLIDLNGRVLFSERLLLSAGARKIDLKQLQLDQVTFLVRFQPLRN